MSAGPASPPGWRGGVDRVVRRFREAPGAVQDRVIGATLAVPAAVVLGTALWLEPDPSGVGTHQQLGLGGCTVLTTFGVPCPMCGMTTTFTHLAHLHVVDGVVNQPFGVVLFGLTVLGLLTGAADLVRPAGRWRRLIAVVDQNEGTIASVILLGMFGGWAWKWAVMSGQLPSSP